MQVSDYARVIRKRWATVVALTLITLASTAAFTLSATPLFTATARLFFAVQGSESVSDLAQGSSFAERQMASYAAVATSPLVLAPVAQQLGLPDDKHLAVRASVPPNTVILEVAATDDDPALAAATANSVAATVASAVSDLQPTRTDGTDAVKATIVTPAIAPSQPSYPEVVQNMALGLLAGLTVGIGVAALREMLDTKIRNESDLSGITTKSVLGAIAFDETARTRPLVMEAEPHGARAEAVRRLRTNLQFVDFTDRPNIIVITSSIPGEGKTTTAVNLAASLADAGARVLLVDADLRRPAVASLLGLDATVGLTTVLVGRAELGEVVQPWGDTSLEILPAGPIPPNPSELLGSKRATDLLGQFASHYDVIVVDSPPLLPVTDAAILSRLAGGALVVVGADRIHKSQLSDALRTLNDVGATVLGLVLNKVPVREYRGAAYGYGYGYGYGVDNPVDPVDEEAPHKQRRTQRTAGRHA